MLQTKSALYNAKLLFISTIILLLMMHVLCDPESEVFQRHTRKRLCGRALSETLANVCLVYGKEKKSGELKNIFVP